MTEIVHTLLTLGRNVFFVFETAEQPRAVENLVQDDSEAVDVTLLGALCIHGQSGGALELRAHQLRRRPQQRWTNKKA